jgi:hypothetical protein
MAPPHVPLNQLPLAVKNSVEQLLERNGVRGIDKIWVGFVAPDAMLAQAEKAAAAIAHEAGGQLSIAEVHAAAGGGHAQAVVKPPRIFGYIHSVK